LSAYLFNIALELLLVEIRSDEGIRGITVDDKEIKLATADDLTTSLQDVNFLANLSLTLRRFGICSGLKLNAEKAEALWLGNATIMTNPISLALTKLTNQLKFLASILPTIRRKNKSSTTMKL